MEKIFALYDSDVFYATRFMEYFKGNKEFNFIITVFTRFDKLEEYVQTHFVEILLLGEQTKIEEQMLLSIKYKYQLTDNQNKKADTDYTQIYKYQPVRAVIMDILNDYNSKERISPTRYNSDQTNIISIFSPVPGIDKMIFSWAISSLMSEQNHVLFVPMELFPLHLPAPFDKSGQSLTEFIYFLKEKSNIINKLNALKNYNGTLSILHGIVHGVDLLSLSKEDIQNWVEELRIHSDYQTIVFYLGCYTEAMIELINLSDSVLVTISDNPYEAAVLPEWERQMGQSGINTRQEKYQYIELPEQENSGFIPLTIPELKSSPTWLFAQQYRNVSLNF